MRGLLLVIVGASLLWLIVSKLGPVDAAGPETETAEVAEPEGVEPATFLARPEPSVEVVEETPDPEPAVAQQPEPSAGQAAPDPAPVRSNEPYALDWTSEQERALAAALLHAPGEIGRWLQDNGRGLSEDRRRLVLALGAAIVGDRGRARSFADGLENAADVLPEERELLAGALDAQDARARAASVRRESYVAHAASMALLAVRARAELDAGHSRTAAQAFSELLLEELEAPWEADSATLASWSADLSRAQRGWRWNRNAEWPGIEVVVQPGDHLTRIRKRVLDANPELLLCTGLIERANEIQGKVIHPDDVLRVPTDRAHALVDLSARWALFMMGDEVVAAWQVGIGKVETPTRTGEYYVGEKETEPMWFRPGQDPVPFGVPENPLGTRWIAWMTPDGKKSSLGFHGTNEPDSMGRAVSEGCIRMRNEQVEELFEILPKDARVLVRP